MISLIVAVADNGVIGKEGGIPWYLPADLTHFKRTTTPHPIIMGRKTHESIGRILPKRLNIIITRNPNYKAMFGSVVVNSLQEALNLPRVKADPEPFIIGGSEIYNQALSLAQRIYLTRVHTKMAGDKYFKFDESKWREVSHEKHKANAQNKYAYDFMVLERKMIATYPSKVG